MNKEFDVYKNYTYTHMLAGVDEAALTRWSISYFAANIKPHLPEDRNASVMEIGCGYGRNIKALEELGYVNARGIDISEEQIAYASNELGLTKVEVGDAVVALSGGSERYDVILLLDVLEHLELAYSVQLFESIQCALKPGGVLIIQVPNALSPLSPNCYGDITHLRAYTTNSMAQHLRLGGFTNMMHFELPPHVHGFASLVRRCIWVAVFKPVIGAYMLVANSDLMGGIYTMNMLTIAYRTESN